MTSGVRGTLVALALLAGCGNGGEPAGDAGAGRVERAEGLAGTIVVVPSSVEAGGELRIAVRNVGRLPLAFGLGNRLERRGGGGWRDVTERFYGGEQPIRDRLVIVEPGRREQPSEPIPVPAGLEAGSYRIVKRVHGTRGDRGPGPPQVTLAAPFEVRR